MAALLTNIFIDTLEKFELYKSTLLDVSEVFDEYHIKVRGSLQAECVNYAMRVIAKNLYFYQELACNDWVSTTNKILQNIRSDIIFLYFEDHKLIAPVDSLSEVLYDFENHELDHLCYSFFRASNLETKNLLPLAPKQYKNFFAYDLSSKNIELLKYILFNDVAYCFSLLSINSKKYLTAVLRSENQRIKLHSRLFNFILAKLFGYPRYKIVLQKLNFLLKSFGIRYCAYPIYTPFNLEKVLFEFNTINTDCKVGILKSEIYANYDDDNNAYGESLIKRGLYPLNATVSAHDIFKSGTISFDIEFNKGELFDCTYFSRRHRISKVPVVEVIVLLGSIIVEYSNEIYEITECSSKLFYTNLSPIIKTNTISKIRFVLYDNALFD